MSHCATCSCGPRVCRVCRVELVGLHPLNRYCSALCKDRAKQRSEKAKAFGVLLNLWWLAARRAVDNPVDRPRVSCAQVSTGPHGLSTGLSTEIDAKSSV